MFSRKYALVALLCIATAITLAVPAFAQSTNRQIGTSLTATADPVVSRPHLQPCVAPLFTNYQFAFFSQTAQNFSFNPPAGCSGPWQKVVLEINFSENAGRQFDRTASVFLGNNNLYFGTTPEPIHSSPNAWHIERDVTDYSALLTSGQQGTFVLANCTTDCGAPYNTLLNGVFTVSADLQFYPGYGQSPVPRTPDLVLPMVQTNSGGGINLPANLFQPTDQLTTTFNLPQNIEGAYLDVIAQSQNVDEQWYACFPNDLSGINEVYGCGNTDFRETEISIDGQPAGIAPVSPWVYTGFLPDQWRPIPAVQTLDFVPFRVNLTPFVGMLNDGNPHTIALSVFNNDFYFSVTSSLLLFLDSGSSQVTGTVTQNTLTLPSPAVSENLQGTSTVTGAIGVISNRNFTIAGYANTSHGQVATSLTQQQNFTSTQTIDFDTVNGSVIDQNTSVQNSVLSSTTVSGKTGTTTTQELFSFPISVDFIAPVANSLFGFTVATSQKYQDSKLTLVNGHLGTYTAVTNAAQASDVQPPSSSQHYTYVDLKGQSYDCRIASANNVLTSVSSSCH